MNMGELLELWKSKEHVELEDYLRQRDPDQTLEGLEGAFFPCRGPGVSGPFVGVLLQAEKPVSERHLVLLVRRVEGYEEVEDIVGFFENCISDESLVAVAPEVSAIELALQPRLDRIRERAQAWQEKELEQLNGYLREVHEELRGRRQTAWQQSWWLEKDQQIQQEEEEFHAELKEHERMLQQRSEFVFELGILFWGIKANG